jgi:hypothetical protein
MTAGVRSGPRRCPASSRPKRDPTGCDASSAAAVDLSSRRRAGNNTGNNARKNVRKNVHE